MCSLFLAILAALLYLSRFSSKSQPIYSFLFKLSPLTWTAIAFALSSLNFLYILFTINIGTYSMLNDTFQYECEYSELGNSYDASALTTISYSISNGVMIFILILINVTILYKLKSKMKRDRSIVSHETSTRRRHIERRLIRIMLIDCLNLTKARLPYLVWYIAEAYSDEFYLTFNYFIGYFSLATYVSFTLKFALFYKLNSRFKSESKQLVNEIKELFLHFRF